MRVIISLVLILAIAACGHGQPDVNDDAGTSEEVKGGETYKEFDKRRDALDGSHGEFEGQRCTQNSGGHEAGYAWAEEKGITDPDQCGGKSWSFIEGCRAYAEQAGE